MYGPRIIVKVPASTANLGPGFDTLGMALSLFAWIEMAQAPETTITLYGDQMNGVPTDKSNLIYKVAQMVFNEAGVSVPELSISMYSDIPLTRGLGSSASAIVGALVAANALIGAPLSDHKLFQMATALEGHPDNVGASLFGGIVVSAWDGEQADYVRIDPHPSLQALVAVPAFQLSTEKARHALPKEISMGDAVYNVSRSSLLVAALATGQLELISKAMKDRLHQPYRAPLIPGMETILAHASERGALGAALSGAGPTLISFVDAQSGRKQELEQFLVDTLADEGIEAETIWLKPFNSGPQLVQVEEGDDLPLIDRIQSEVRV
ncbi:homoserine kinase [Paenibacillus curdlanolyticus YK9]|uniref:Homoserine kinase n=1 Tax=Paenibacillus curdlanolyticus YK9 TaxID=717606 RepID=E0IDW6_9BACL|nr:homoserine kinase [Paenibacillus curdlanolyticus]EFM09320.1 homoserine kinase [Paenibacillus curdlanolyticus YK9]